MGWQDRLVSTRESDKRSGGRGLRLGGGLVALAAVLTAAEQNGAELSAGDFVRWCRQVLDLLDQIAGVAGRGSAVGRAAVRAGQAVRRGVVAVGAT